MLVTTVMLEIRQEISFPFTWSCSSAVAATGMLWNIIVVVPWQCLCVCFAFGLGTVQASFYVAIALTWWSLPLGMSPLKRRPLKTIEFFENHKIVPFPARKAVNSHEVHGLGLVLLAIHKFLASDGESGAQFWRIIQAHVFQYSLFFFPIRL